MRMPHAAVRAARAEWARRHGAKSWPLERGSGFYPRSRTEGEIAEAEALVDAATFPDSWALLGFGDEFAAVQSHAPVVAARAAVIRATFGEKLLSEPWRLDWGAWRSVPEVSQGPTLSDSQAGALLQDLEGRLPDPTNTLTDVEQLRKTLPMTAAGASSIFTQMQLGTRGQTYQGVNWGNVNGVAELLRGYFGPMPYSVWLSNTINMRNLLRQYPGWTKKMEREWAKTIGEMAMEYRRRGDAP